MSYFTRNPMERLMTQKPRAMREEAPAAPKGHPCYGCKRYGMECVRPCYREYQNKKLVACNWQQAFEDKCD